MHRRESKPNLFHQRLRWIDYGVARRAGCRSAAISARAMGMAAYSVLQALIRPDDSAQCRPHFRLASIIEHHVPQKRETKISKQGGMLVTKISLLGLIDNLGSGLVGPLMSYWFFLRFGVELKSLGFMFFLSYFLAALSFLAAPMIARHIGVVRTMAFSHGAASLL